MKDIDEQVDVSLLQHLKEYCNAILTQINTWHLTIHCI